MGTEGEDGAPGSPTVGGKIEERRLGWGAKEVRRDGKLGGTEAKKQGPTKKGKFIIINSAPCSGKGVLVHLKQTTQPSQRGTPPSDSPKSTQHSRPGAAHTTHHKMGFQQLLLLSP